MQYTFSEHSAEFGFNVLQGPVTGDVYHIARLQNISPAATMIARVTDMNTFVWTRYYGNYLAALNSICMDSDEKFIYLIMMNTVDSYTQIHSFNTENGYETLAKTISNSK